MNLRPCRRCRIRDGCERKARMLERLRGSGVTLASFRCPERLSGLEPGRRVRASIRGLTTVFSYDGPDYIDGEAVGTVMGKSSKDPLRIVVRLDEPIEGNGRRYVKLYPDVCVPLDEVRALCSWSGDTPWTCGEPLGGDGTCPQRMDHAHDEAIAIGVGAYDEAPL